MNRLLALALLCIAIPALAASSITLSPGDSVTVTAGQGGVTPPPVVPPPPPPPPPPPAGWNGVCAGFDNTIVLDLDWNAPGRYPAINMRINDAVVGRFTTGNVSSPQNNLPRISGAEYSNGPPSARYAVLSEKPCDWSAQQYAGAVSAGNTIQLPFAVEGNGFNYYPILKKMTTYYANVKNLSQNESCSAQGACGFFLELSKPGGI